MTDDSPIRRGLPRTPPGASPRAENVVSPRSHPAETVDEGSDRQKRPAGWKLRVAIGALIVVAAAAAAVVASRWLVTLPFMRDFMSSYPGETELPPGAPVGFPAWLAWQHFLNSFVMVLIIRTGLQIRIQRRPRVHWTPRWRSGARISLSAWFHQALDILWIVNGVAFLVLLFLTGQWMRVVPLTWDVWPNAVSAGVQYLTLDWPTENGWVNYNSLQLLAYFTTIFIAAPLATLTGVRMSGLWPRNTMLGRVFPVEWARAVHFPVMLYFVVFIIVHVALVLATGALRNLNHMYAARGSTDPAAYAGDWLGFAIFLGSLAVIAAAWLAARPLILSSIARAFGTVSGR